jgi:hypothetical protein
VDKSQFLTVVQHFSDSSVEEAQEILSLKESFPYSQLLHALSARVSRDHGFSTQQSELQLAAVYAVDRSVLKDVMTLAASDFVVAPTPSEIVTISAPATAKIAEPVKAAAATVVNDYEDVADEIIHDLDRLHELKHNFEMLFADGPAVQKATVREKAPEPTPVVAEPVKQVKAEATEPDAKESTKSRKQRIIEMAKAVAATRETPAVEAKPPIKPKKRKEPTDSLIEEIQNNKEELAPSDEKLKHQIEVIDQFIKTQPSIINVKDKLASAPVGDLSSIKSGEFSDHIVSETLVEILIQQGKKDKAIEVLKKLIWKFPQKKAYFAAQIEELKK